MSTYEAWLTDDAGKRLYMFEKFSSLSYSRTTHGYGTCQLLIPYDKFIADFGSFPKPDMRIDIWRSPDVGIPARREGSFLIRKPLVYQRETDGVRIMETFGRSPIDILRRQNWKVDSNNTGATADDLMKGLVRGRYTSIGGAGPYSTAPTVINSGVYTYTGEFVVDEDTGDGPLVSGNFYLKNILDTIQNIKQATFTLNAISASNKRIFFDVIEDDSLVDGGFGYRFRTYPTLRGQDRTLGTIFSTENGNLAAPTYYEDYLDEITSVFSYNSASSAADQNAQTDDQYLSRWNYIEEAVTTSEEDANAALTNIYGTLRDKGAKKSFNADFLNSPGSPSQPRSLYGIDWDLGDLLPCKFAGQVFNSEVAIVYVGLNEQGAETISGKTSVGS